MNEAESKKKLLFTLNEIIQVTTIFEKQKDLQLNSKISVNIVKKHSPHSEVTLFSVKVAYDADIPFLSLIQAQCMPHLLDLITSMQGIEKESHLAVKSRDENGQIYTVLWIDDESVKVISQRKSSRKDQNHLQCAIQMRIFLSVTAMCECSVEICELMECFKMMNPMTQLKFNMDFGGFVEFQLCNTTSVTRNHLNIYAGLEIFNRKLLDCFHSGIIEIHSSQQYNLKHISASILISCIVCYIPLFATNAQLYSADKIKQYTSGTIKIHLYGPHGLPLCINLVSDVISLHPHTLLAWNEFGIHVKQKFKGSTFSLESAARRPFGNENTVWKKCDRFILLFNFVVDHGDVSHNEQNQDVTHVRNEKEFFKHLEEKCQSRDALNTFKQAALSGLNILINHIKGHRCVPSSLTKKTIDKNNESNISEKMVPDVVNSLIGIFTRSTNTEFRSKVALFMPTESRKSMCHFLEGKLMRQLKTPGYGESNITPTSVPAESSDTSLPEAEEGDIDDWNFTDSIHLDKHRSLISTSSVVGDLFEDSLAMQGFVEKSSHVITSLHNITNSSHSINYNEPLKSCVQSKLPQWSNQSGSVVTNARDRQNGETAVATTAKIGHSSSTASKYIHDNENKSESSESSKRVELRTPHRQFSSMVGDDCVVLKPTEHQLMYNTAITALYQCDTFIQPSLSDCFTPSTEMTFHLGQYDSCPANDNPPLEESKHMFTRKRSSDDKEPLNEGAGVVQYHNQMSQADNKKLKMITTEDDFHHSLSTDEHKRHSLTFESDTSLQMYAQEEDNDWFNESEVAKWFAEMEH